jgi:hypothetical protein
MNTKHNHSAISKNFLSQLLLISSSQYLVTFLKQDPYVLLDYFKGSLNAMRVNLNCCDECFMIETCDNHEACCYVCEFYENGECNLAEELLWMELE